MPVKSDKAEIEEQKQWQRQFHALEIESKLNGTIVSYQNSAKVRLGQFKMI